MIPANVKIGPVTIGKAKVMLCDLLDTYTAEMDRAYKQQDDDLSVGLSLKFRPAANGAVEVAYAIRFVQSVVKDGDKMICDEQQQAIPFKPGITAAN